MENATKALLIAAAVLVAILIISLGLVVYNMAAETMGNVNLSEAEIQQFNDKFTRYEGTSQSGTQVNAMLNTVFTHNMSETDEGRKVTVVEGAASGTGTDVLTGDETTKPKKVDTGRRYTVVAEYDNQSKLINKITFTENSSTP
ncbi:MAG: hypothetical protein HFJ55_04005 [Clostridia bacterium]|nr:hypothetical protein [Clostridia bacterium]